MKVTYSSNNPVGKGSYYSWMGEKSGEGKLTILEEVPNQSIKTQLDFKGMGTSYGKWKFEETGNGTKVTWGFDSELSGFTKWMGLTMDSFLGGQFEEGLAEIKKLAESMPAPVVGPAPVAVPVSAN